MKAREPSCCFYGSVEVSSFYDGSNQVCEESRGV